MFFIVVQVQLSPFSPYHNPPLHLSPSPTLKPTPFGWNFVFSNECALSRVYENCPLTLMVFNILHRFFFLIDF